MFYSADSDITYRDHLITETLRTNEVNEWFSNLVDSVEVNTLNTKYVRTDLVLGN